MSACSIEPSSDDTLISILWVELIKYDKMKGDDVEAHSSPKGRRTKQIKR